MIDEKAQAEVLRDLVDPWHKSFAQQVIEMYEEEKSNHQPDECRAAYEKWEESYWAEKKKYPSSWQAWQAAWVAWQAARETKRVSCREG